MEERRKTSRPTGPIPKMKNHVSRTRRPKETSKLSNDNSTNSTILLVARSRRVDNKIRRQLQTMSRPPTDHQSNPLTSLTLPIRDWRNAGKVPNDPRRVEHPTPDPRRTKWVAERRTPSNSPRRRIHMKDSSNFTRHTNSRTPQPRRDFRPSLSCILVAWDANLDNKLCCGLCNLSAK